MLHLHILDPPDIDEGPFVPKPSNITRGNKRVKIGTPVYIHNGFDVIIDCFIVYGERPITIQWFRNGLPDPTRGNDSTITITDPSNNEVFTCRANNSGGFDTENTTIYLTYGKNMCVIRIHAYKSVYIIYLYVRICIRMCTHTCI